MAQSQDAAPATAAASPPAPRTILVVDDELGPRESLKQILTPAYQVVIAKNGREALECFPAVRPDLVISDIRMPTMSGVELMKALRQLSPETPFVLLTGYATLESAQEAVRQGAFDYLNKPYHVQEIRAMVARALAAADSRRETRLQRARLEEVNSLLQSQIRELNQKATLGELSAEMIHDLNNPMSVLGGYIALLEDSLTREPHLNPAESREFIEVIKRQIERCVVLTRRFLDYARNSRQAWDREDVNEVLQDTIFVLRVRMRSLHVTLELDLGADLPRTWIQPTPLQQVFYNLVTNALDAMATLEAPRSLRVSTRLRPAGGSLPGVESMIEVIVQDSGPGIPAELRERVFEPFFSTKPKGKGTGLGLSLCRRIVEEHGGAIAVDSAPGQGTCFTVRLPLRQEKPASANLLARA